MLRKKEEEREIMPSIMATSIWLMHMAASL